MIEMIIEQAEGHPSFSARRSLSPFAMPVCWSSRTEKAGCTLTSRTCVTWTSPTPSRTSSSAASIACRPRQRSILKVASVIGREFSVDTLVEIYPAALDHSEAIESLQTLVVLDLVHEVTLDRSRYRFRHAITRDIAYGLLLFSQKSELHRAVAASLERSHVDASTPWPPHSPTTGATA